MKCKIAALIPARGGSKGIKNKNLVDIDTLPLVVHSILAASGAERVDAVYVSSDSDRILSVAETYGARAIKRPAEYAKDESTTESVISHFLTEVQCKDIVLIQPTSPMLLPSDLDRGFRVYFDDRKKKHVDCVFSAVIANDTLIWDEEGMFPLNYDPKSRGRRQTRKRKILIENGAFYIFSKKIYIRTGCRIHGSVGYAEMPFWRSFQVDNYSDLKFIRTLMTTRI